MFRRSFAVFLAIFLAFPPGAFPAEKAAEPPSKSGVGGPFFWGALALLNGTILVSSIGDLRFYEERADEVDAAGEDAGAYWDAGSREKVVIGLSALSLVFSLAGLEQSLKSRARVEDIPPLAAKPQVLPTPPGPVQVLSLEGRVRYDTLFAQQAAPPPEIQAGPSEVPVRAVPEAAPEGVAVAPVDSTAADVASILQDLEQASPASGPPPEAGPPSPSPAPATPSETAPKAQAPAGPPPEAQASVPKPSPPRPAAKEKKEPTFTLLPFGVHVTSFRTMAEAERDEARWGKLGERVSIEEDEVPEKGTWFRVLLGNFATLDEARAYADSVKQRHGVDYAMARRRAGM